MEYSKNRSIKNYLISPEEQIYQGVAGFIIFFAGLGLQSLFILRNYSPTFSEMDSFENIEIFQNILVSFFVISLIGGFTFFILNIFYTHRIYGSIYVIEKQIQKVLNGETVTDLKGRKNDKVRNLVPLVNELIQKYQNKEAQKDQGTN